MLKDFPKLPLQVILIINIIYSNKYLYYMQNDVDKWIKQKNKLETYWYKGALSDF